MKYSFVLAIVSLSLLSCEFSVKTYEKKTDSQNSKIRNGIRVQAKGVNVEQAFLLTEDGTLLPQDNKIEIKQKIKLRLIANGWQEKDGRVYLEASQKIIKNDGAVIVDQTDLFKADSISSILPADARYITLSFWFDEIDELFDYVTVEFKVWDKLGEGEVKGSYRLYLK